jgi:hypothetical protein
LIHRPYWFTRLQRVEVSSIALQATSSVLLVYVYCHDGGFWIG